MRVMINAASLQKGGALQVALSVLEELQVFKSIHFTVLLSPQLAAIIPPGFASHFSFFPLSQNPTASFTAWRGFRRTARQLEQDHRPDVVLTIFGPALWRPRAPHVMGFANGLYLFSDSRFIQQDWPLGRTARLRYAARRRILLHRVQAEADAWWVETPVAQASLAKVLGVEKHCVEVIPNAVGQAFVAYLQGTVPAAPADGVFRLLVMGSAYPNKNLALVQAVLPLVASEKVRFQVTLPEDEFRNIFGSLGKSSAIENLGPLHPADGPKAYVQADAVFAPSKLETFSAVYLEAMAMQRPILASDLPFAHAVCGEAAQYFDPWSAESAARAIREIMQEPGRIADLVAKGVQQLKRFPTAADRAASLVDLLKKVAKTGT